MSNCYTCMHFLPNDGVCVKDVVPRFIDDKDRVNASCDAYKKPKILNKCEEDYCQTCMNYEKGFCKKEGPKTKVKGRCVWFESIERKITSSCWRCKRYKSTSNKCITDTGEYELIFGQGEDKTCIDFERNPDQLDGDRFETMLCKHCDKLQIYHFLNGNKKPICMDGEKRYYLVNDGQVNTRIHCYDYICMNKKEYYIPDCKTCSYYNSSHHTCTSSGEEREFALDDITSIIPNVKCLNYKEKYEEVYEEVYEKRFKVDTCFPPMCYECTRLTPKLDYDIHTSSSEGTSAKFSVTCKYIDQCLDELEEE